MTKYVLMLGSMFSFATAVPTQSQAGVIPWVYDTIFGPVGSIRSRAAYAPMYTAYNYGGTSAGYAPASFAYAPSAFASNCSSCQSSANYAPAIGYDAYYAYPQVTSQVYGGNCNCSPCASGNCASGNCASGNCASGNCATGSNQSSNYGSAGVAAPTPDPYLNQSRDSTTRMLDLERKLDELDRRQKEDERLLRLKHPEDYTPYRSGTYREEPVRQRKDSFGGESNPDSPEMQLPRRGTHKSEVDKPVLPVPGATEGEKKDEAEKPQARRLDDQRTTRAVAPRERMQIVTVKSKMAIAKADKKRVTTSDSTVTTELVNR